MFYILMGLFIIVYVNAPIIWAYININNSANSNQSQTSVTSLADIYNPELSYIENLFVDIEDIIKRRIL